MFDFDIKYAIKEKSVSSRGEKRTRKYLHLKDCMGPGEVAQWLGVLPCMQNDCGLNPHIPHGPSNLPGVISECRTRISPWVLPDMTLLHLPPQKKDSMTDLFQCLFFKDIVSH